MHSHLILLVLASSNIALSFLIQLYVVSSLGPGAESDAFFAAQTLPSLLISIAVTSLARVLVPQLSKLDLRGTRILGWWIVYLVFGLSTALAIALNVSVSEWVPTLFPGFVGERLDLAQRLSAVQVLGIVPLSLVGILTAVHHAQGRFHQPELVSLCLNGVAFAAIVYELPRNGVIAVVWILVARAFISTILLTPALGWPQFRRGVWQHVQSIWKQLRPLLYGGAIYKFAPLVDRYLASMAAAGLLSIYSLGQTMYSASLQLLDRSVVAKMVPSLAQSASQSDWAAVRVSYRKRASAVAVSVAIAALLLVGVGFTLLKWAFGESAFGPQELEILWWVLIGLLGVGFGGGIGQIAASTFYSIGNTLTPTRIGVVGFMIGIGVKVGAFAAFGLSGLVLATSFYYVLNAFLMVTLLERELHDRCTLSRGT